MQTKHQVLVVLASFVVMLLMGSCEHAISTGTTVYPDGAIDRSIVLHNTDSGHAEKNIFGINSASGWDVEIGPPSKPADENDKDPEVDITFKRHFASVEEANNANPDTDTVFHLVSTFHKENRWFYTYLEYHDTYRALNIFKAVPIEEYFTKEDIAFIDRMPAEGTAISTADSLYLARLNEKIFDLYGARTIFEEFYQHLAVTMREHNVPGQWQDTLQKKKNGLYDLFVKNEDFDNEDLVSLIDKMNIPLPPAGRDAISQRILNMERRLEFLSQAYSGSYVHTMKLPWSVVESNADSIVNNELFWRPPVLKFLLSDYTMSAKARRMNPWAVTISALFVCLTLVLFFFRTKR